MSRTRNVVITGAGSGIGRAAAQLFAEHGDRVWCWDIDETSATAVARGIQDSGGQAVAIRCDVTSEDDVIAAFRRLDDDQGSVDVVLVNAGISGPVRPLHEVTIGEFRQVLDVNLIGAFLLTKHAVPLLRGNGGGAMVMTASIMSHIATPAWGSYAVSKGGLLALARSLAVDYAGDGIRVNCVSPDSVNTELLHRSLTGSGMAESEWDEFQRSIATPRQIADVAYFLASDQASLVNGASVLLDGGHTITY